MLDLLLFIKLLIQGRREHADPTLDPRHPANLSINYTDPESVLNAAARFDQFGEWDRAFHLYALAAETWPELFDQIAVKMPRIH